MLTEATHEETLKSCCATRACATGLTFSRAPQQLINILTLGDPNGKGCFFPEGFSGRINKPAGASPTIWQPSATIFSAREFHIDQRVPCSFRIQQSLPR